MNKPSRPTSLTQMKPGPVFQPSGIPKPPDLPEPPQYDVQSTGLAGTIRTHHGREVPPDLSKGKEIFFEALGQFTRYERLKIALGCNVQVRGSILCRHNPGVVAPAISLTVEDKKIRKLSLDELNEKVKDRLRGAFGRSKKLKLKTDEKA